MNEAFESAQFLIRQTKSDMERFKAMFNAWISSGSYTSIIEVDAKTGNHIHKVCFSDPIPEDLRGISSNALNNLRHCFDQANSAVYSVVNGIEAPDRFYFPFATCPKDLDGRLRNTFYTNFPKSALDAIRSVEPYPTGVAHKGGNDLFAIFCGAAGRNKHRATANLNGFIREFRSDQIIGHKIVDMGLPPIWDVAKGEMVVGITAPDGRIDYNFQITPEITFGNAEKLTGTPIYGACLATACIAEKLINELNSSLP